MNLTAPFNHINFGTQNPLFRGVFYYVNVILIKSILIKFKNYKNLFNSIYSCI